MSVHSHSTINDSALEILCQAPYKSKRNSMLQVPFSQMSPPRSPKNTTRQPSPTFQIENRILTLEQLQGIIHTCVKHKLESLQQIGQSTEFLLSHTSTKPKFKRFGEWVPRFVLFEVCSFPSSLTQNFQSRHMG